MATPEKLGELLQRKQEPFVLEIYLTERGYLSRSFSSKFDGSSFGCCRSDPSKMKGIRSFPNKVFKAIFNKFGHGNQPKNTTQEAEFSVVINDENVAARERFSSAESEKAESVSSSSNQRYDSVMADKLEGLRLSNMTDEETYAGREFEFQFMENNKHSPVSVLEQIPLSPKFGFRKREENQTTCTVCLPCKTLMEEFELSAPIPMSKLRFQSILEKPIRIGGSGILNYDPSPQFVKSRRMLQETRQLLFDCVREIVEMKSHGNGNLEKRHKGLLGPEELGNLLFERMKAWDDKQVRSDHKNPTSLRNSDVFDSPREWNDFELEKREICAQIGDAIAEELVKEIVAESMTYRNCTSVASTQRIQYTTFVFA